MFSAVLWLVTLSLGFYSVTRAEVWIDADGGYKNVVVGINPQVPESKIDNLIFELEVLFKNASKLLHTATRGQTFFKEVVIALPKKYRSKQGTADGKYFRDPNIVVTAGDAFSSPYAVQNDGCGKQGLRIHLPEDYLYGNSNGKEKALVQEWAKYRYGVFDEGGFIGDPLYPACYTIPGSEEIRATECTNKEINYEFRKTNMQPDLCNKTPVGDIANILSSLMSKTDFPKAIYFCDDEEYPHNRNIPSKQNALCREKSTWKIISQHQDFKFKPIRSNRRTVPEISFKYVVQSEFRLILAADTSSRMAENDRLDMVGNAFSYFILFNLPENSTVGIKNLKDKESNPILVTVRSPADSDRIIDAFPEAYGEGSICVYCGIEQALQTLKMNSAVSQGDLVITSATDIEESHVKSLESALSKNEVTLHVIYFKKRLKEPPLLQKLVTASGGKFFYIPDELSENSPSSLLLIYEAFRSIYESSSWMNRNHVLVDQATFARDVCTKCSISFKSDRSMESFQVLLTGPEFNAGPPVIKERTILSNGNQDFAPGHSSFSYKTKIPAYVFSIKHPKPGTWSLTFERKPNYNKPLVVIVRSTVSQYTEIINMQSWINIENDFKQTVLQRPPIKLYSEVKKGNFPVLNIAVTANLYKPDSGEHFTLELFDQGDGDPDITRNDGIFSRYISKALDTGYYVLTMTAESNTPETWFEKTVQDTKVTTCCGSYFPTDLGYDAGPLKRVVAHESLFIESSDNSHVFPPRRIVDLRVDKVMILRGKLSYVLNWTAPGNDYDYGTAIDYQMRIFSDRDTALSNFESGYIQTIDNFDIHGHILEPSIAGSHESVILELKNLTNGTYFLAIRTINSIGEVSDTSNVVKVKHQGFIIQPNHTTEYPYTNDPNSSTETYPWDQHITSTSEFKIAIGVTGGLLFLFLIIGIIALFCARSRRNKDKEAMRQEVISRYGGAPSVTSIDDSQKAESSDALCENSNAMNISVISPVNSWPANSLLSHYETLQRNKSCDNSETSTVIPKDTSDTASISSSKYSYINRIDQNTSMYDPIYFPPQDRDNMHPFNPGYAPFNPTYTSSLRKNQDNTAYVDTYARNQVNAYNYAPESGMTPLPHYASLQRYPNDNRMENSFVSNGAISYEYELDRGRRLGTDL
ncbi:hypothetical protein JTE90_008376 [Oedothorax gibbosus]|uniref:Calcium-activated chloride channel N-terminal domain-containing protein n=1 Tax=Oedothorax gibbosus TaxID=931172 RepID=A0AAV6V3T2_9ARAC|nr:hypothetical protein JTE90_008376 [Oedothorax gibbosus]